MTFDAIARAWAGCSHTLLVWFLYCAGFWAFNWIMGWVIDRWWSVGRQIRQMREVLGDHFEPAHEAMIQRVWSWHQSRRQPNSLPIFTYYLAAAVTMFGVTLFRNAYPGRPLWPDVPVYLLALVVLIELFNCLRTRFTPPRDDGPDPMEEIMAGMGNNPVAERVRAAWLKSRAQPPPRLRARLVLYLGSIVLVLMFVCHGHHGRPWMAGILFLVLGVPLVPVFFQLLRVSRDQRRRMESLRRKSDGEE